MRSRVFEDKAKTEEDATCMSAYVVESNRGQSENRRVIEDKAKKEEFVVESNRRQIENRMCKKTI
jgi:hypothetical protein